MKPLGELKLLRKFLQQLGLSPEEERIYSTLVELGSATVLAIARAASVNRTTTYRLLEKLKASGLVEEMVDEHKSIFRVSGSHMLEQAVRAKEAESKLLRDLLPSISPLISSVGQNQQPGTKVLFYRGSEGIKQMIWNVLKAKNEVVGYTYRSVWEITGLKFAHDWYREFKERQLHFKDIYSDAYLFGKNPPEIIEHKENFASRYVPASLLDINHQEDIYNDVIGLYNWYEGEVFGVEIYNEKIAAMHKQLFEIVWKLGSNKLA